MNITLESVIAVDNTIAIRLCLATGHVKDYWYPLQVAIYRESLEKSDSLHVIYLDNRFSSEIRIKVDDSSETLPNVRLFSQRDSDVVIPYTVLDGEIFKALLTQFQKKKHICDYVAEDAIREEKARNISVDIEELKEDLILHGIKLRSSVVKAIEQIKEDADFYLYSGGGNFGLE